MLFPEDKNIDLSISIVSYNVRELLAECLQSIIDHTKAISYELIVVDNCSRDGTLEMLAQNFPEVKVLPNRKNRGFAAAMNRGLGMGRGRYLFSLDSDTYIKEDSFSAMVRFIDQHPDAGAAGAKLLSPDGTPQYSRRRFPPSLWPVIYRGSFLRHILPPTKQVRYYEMSDVVLVSDTEVGWVYGGNIIFRRKALEQVGLFDERFFIYCEDIDISYRMKEHGWKRFFVTDARIFHYGQQGTKQIKVRSYLRHLRSYTKLFHKYNWQLDERFQCNFDRSGQACRLVFVLVNDGQKDLLEGCLRAIYDAPPEESYKIVVVDEASRDGSLDMLKERYPEVMWIANQKKNGYYPALNRALRLTESDYLIAVPLNPRAIFGQFQKLCDYLEQRPRAGMAGLIYDNKEPFALSDNKINEKELFEENCMMIRRNIRGLELAGAGVGNKGDDLDWCARFRKEGWAVYYLLNT